MMIFMFWDLKGSRGQYKGFTELHNFWCRFETEFCDVTRVPELYKLFSAFSFCFEHSDKAIVEKVYKELTMGFKRLYCGNHYDEITIDQIGYITFVKVSEN